MVALMVCWRPEPPTSTVKVAPGNGAASDVQRAAAQCGPESTEGAARRGAAGVWAHPERTRAKPTRAHPADARTTMQCDGSAAAIKGPSSFGCPAGHRTRCGPDA